VLTYVLSAASSSDIEKKRLRANSGKLQYQFSWRKLSGPPTALGLDGFVREELHMILREQLGREASPTAAVIDSQTLKAAEKGAVLTAR
jgi:hypothetical protein